MAKYNQSQILRILKEQEGGKTILDICKEYDISVPTFYVWKRKHSTLSHTHSKEMIINQLEKENAKLRKMYIALSLDYWENIELKS